jgi:transaldolase/glucose-6-phosphate isomerase
VTVDPGLPPKPPALPPAAITALLPAALQATVSATWARWRAEGGTERLWARDAGLWTGGNEDRWLGWLDAATIGIGRLPLLAAFARDVFEAEYEHVLLLGMGGSSLGPEVVGKTLGAQPYWPQLHVLDSTDPRQIRAVEAAIDYATTLFIVSSKSGSTLEVSLLLDYFLGRAQAILGQALAKRQFVAITDPGSKLEGLAKATGFNHVFSGEPTIGGRFSVLSPFGLVPAAAIGVDLARYLHAAAEMEAACRQPDETNPGVELGIILAAAAGAGHDKLTLVAGPGLESFGAWAEQLVAESTGKNGQAIIPIDGEPLASPASYGSDRLFFHMSFADRTDPHAGKLAALAAAGHPVLQLRLRDKHQLAQEFLRWEIATAVAGALMRLNPFDQPDVEASKIATKRLTADYGETGVMPSWPVIAADGTLTLSADDANAAALIAGDATIDTATILRRHLARLAPGDYCAILAYLPQAEAVAAMLQAPRLRIRERYKVATCLQFGPRFLHSTGQAYKGGPASGVFIQITTDEPDELTVPGEKYGFGTVKLLQALGDAQILAERGRRLLCVHLTGDLTAALASFARMVDMVLA